MILDYSAVWTLRAILSESSQSGNLATSLKSLLTNTNTPETPRKMPETDEPTLYS